MRRTAIAGIALAVAACLAGCTSLKTEEWGAADLLVVGTEHSKPVLIGVDVESSRAFVAADLGKRGVKSADTSNVSYGAGRFLLDWTAGNEPRRYAWLDPASQSVSVLDAPPIDLGIVRLADDKRVLGVAPFAASDPKVTRLSLTDNRLESSEALSLTPAAVAVGKSHSVVVGTTDRDGAVIQRVAPDLALGQPVVAARNALPGQVAVVGGYTVVALNKRVPAGVSPRAKAVFDDDNRVAVLAGDRPVRYVTGASAPWFATAVNEHTVATNGVANGRHVIQVIDVASAKVTQTFPLPDNAPPQGLVTLPSGKLAVLQPENVTVIDLSSRTTTTIALPTTTATTWAG